MKEEFYDIAPFVKIWEDKIAAIERGEVAMTTGAIPQPYFSGQGMDKERQLAFCRRMIAKLHERKHEK